MDSAYSPCHHHFRQRSTSLNVLLMLLLSCFAIGSANAQSDAANTNRVSGSIQTSEGTPVADADVWLIGGTWNDPTVLAKVKSNPEGLFEFDISEHQESLRRLYDIASVIAHYKEHGLGWFMGLSPERRRDISLKLQSTTQFQGQLVDASDQPIANATIYPTNLWRGSMGKLGHQTRIPKDLLPRWQAQTNEEGILSIPGLPAAGVAKLRIEHPTIEYLTVRLNLSQKATIKFDASVEAPGKIELPAGFDRSEIDESNIGTVELYGASLRDQEGDETQDYKSASMVYESQFSAPIKSDFSFQFSNLIAGSYQMRVEFSDSVPLIPPPKPIECKIGSAPEPLVIKALPAVRVLGKVVGRDSGTAVAGAKMRIYTLKDGYSQTSANSVTDAQGMYSAVVPPGKLFVCATDTPKEFVPSPQVGSKSPAILKASVTEDTVLPDFSLDPATDIVIQVTDEHGQPAADAIVKVVTAFRNRDQKPVPKTDADGQYTIRQVAANDGLPIWVRTPTAISEPLVVTPEELDGPIEISLSTQGVRFRVKIIDDDDEPIEGASVSVYTAYWTQSKWVDFGLSGSAGSGKTDDEGVFVSGPLWTGKRHQYHLNVSAEGYSKAETPRLKGKTGEIVDAGQLVLTSARSLEVKGKVVDASGSPVSDASVFCSGKDYRQARATTDASGQFTLNEIAPDLKYVFVEHPDYRFGGGKVSDSEALEIMLRSKKDPPKGVRQWKPLNIQRQHEAAQELILQALELPIGARSSSRRALLRSLDRIGSQPTNKRSMENENGVFNRSIQSSRVQRMEVRDHSEVIPILRTLRERTAFEIARRFCGRLSRSDDEADHKIADKYLKFAEEIVGAEISPQIQLASLYSRRGKTEKAVAVIDELLKKVKDKKFTLDRHAKQNLAVAFAPIDFDKAMELTKELEEGATRTFAQADVALAILKQDSEKSLAAIANLKGDSNAPNIRDKTRFRAALMLVDKDPETAIDLVYQCEDKGNRSQALARLAVRVADFDRPKSWEMIEEAIGVYRKRDAHRGWWGNGGDGPFAAAVAYQANLVEYPDMESVIWHVLAACRSGREKAQERLSATISTARILALTDKVAARELLRSVASQQDQIPRETGGRSLYDQYLQAWTLVDFGRATALIREDLERIEKAGADKHFRYGQRHVFQLLVAPPEERFHLLFAETGLWKLTEDGTQGPW